MSVHERITTAIHQIIEQQSAARDISPNAVAALLVVRFSEHELEPEIEFGCFEHFKEMARKSLAGRFDNRAADNDDGEDELPIFSGQLQQRYPLPHKRGEDSVYRRLEELTPTEMRWNGQRFLKAGRALVAHGHALIARAEAREGVE
jgi:hypothetical protein